MFSVVHTMLFLSTFSPKKWPIRENELADGLWAHSMSGIICLHWKVPSLCQQFEDSLKFIRWLIERHKKTNFKTLKLVVKPDLGHFFFMCTNLMVIGKDWTCCFFKKKNKKTLNMCTVESTENYLPWFPALSVLSKRQRHHRLAWRFMQAWIKSMQIYISVSVAVQIIQTSSSIRESNKKRPTEAKGFPLWGWGICTQISHHSIPNKHR